MKKIFISLILLVSFSLLSSCSKDDSLDPRPVIVSGQFIKFDIINKVINSEDFANSTFGGVITAPGGKVSKYKIYVRKFNGVTSATDFMLLKEITQFPADTYFTVADLATALQIPVSNFKEGDFLGFYGESFDAAGTRADYSSLSPTIIANSASYKQGYRFNCGIQNTTAYGPADYSEINNWVGQ